MTAFLRILFALLFFLPLSKLYAQQTWALSTVTPTSGERIAGIAHDGTKFGAVTANNLTGAALSSTDGINWIESTFAADPISYGIGYYNGLFGVMGNWWAHGINASGSRGQLARGSDLNSLSIGAASGGYLAASENNSLYLTRNGTVFTLLPDQATEIRGLSASPAGATLGTTPQLTINVVDQPLQAWHASRFPDPLLPSAFPNADFDNDGVPNFVEFLLGLDPTADDSPTYHQLLNPTLAPGSSQMTLSLSVAVDPRINVTAEFSGTLQNIDWSSNEVHTSSGAISGGQRTLTFTDLNPLGITTRFIRLIFNYQP